MKNNMMNEKDRQRVKRYIESDGLASIWHYMVIALLIGNVDVTVNTYLAERAEEEGHPKEIADALRAGRRSGYWTVSDDRRDPRVDEEESEDIDLLTAAILATHISDNPQTMDYSSNPEPSTQEWGGFGGGGDFGGGGAGGSWGSDSY
jgi:uncharacterized membrane protein YgcG